MLEKATNPLTKIAFKWMSYKLQAKMTAKHWQDLVQLYSLVEFLLHAQRLWK